MKVRFHSKFLKNYKRRISKNKKLVNQVRDRINRFKDNPKDPILKTHNLTGAKKGLSAFSVTGDIRILYQEIAEEEVIFIDIGTHNQVYA